MLSQLLKKNKLIKKLLQYEKKHGYITIHVNSCEKWNYSEPHEEPKKDGSFDVEGHSSADVEASYYMNPFTSFDDLTRFIVVGWDWVKDSFEFKSLSYTVETFPFKRLWQQWVFVVDSYKTTKYDIVEKKEGYTLDDYKKIEKKLGMKYNDFIGDAINKITDTEIEKFLDKDYYRVTRGFHISKTDPTCMIFNEKIFYFDLKDGWSDKKIGYLISEYFKRTLGKSVIVNQEEEGYSRLKLMILSFKKRLNIWK